MKKKYKYLDLILCLAVAMMVISNTTAAKITQLSIFTVSVTFFIFHLPIYLGMY